MASSAGGRAAMHRQHDPNFDSSIARSSTLRVDYDSHADDQDDDEMDEERIQAQKEMQMVSKPSLPRERAVPGSSPLPTAEECKLIQDVDHPIAGSRNSQAGVCNHK